MIALIQRQMWMRCAGWRKPVRGDCNASALAAVIYPRRQDRSSLRARAGLNRHPTASDDFLAGRWSFRAPAAYRRADYPSVACPAPLSPRQLDRLFPRATSSSRGFGQLGAGLDRPTFIPLARGSHLPGAHRRSAGGPSLLNQRIAVSFGLSAIAGCRLKFLSTARHVLQDRAEPSPVGLHSWPPFYAINRSGDTNQNAGFSVQTRA